jgi:hypothetical protein
VDRDDLLAVVEQRPPLGKEVTNRRLRRGGRLCARLEPVVEAVRVSKDVGLALLVPLERDVERDLLNAGRRDEVARQVVGRVRGDDDRHNVWL